MRDMATTLVPPRSARPDVLPTDRLLANGMAVPALRAELRRIDGRRNALTVVMVWLWVAAIIGGAVWIGQWWAYLAAFVLMAPMDARLAILMHEAAHRLLFNRKRWNDWVGTWLIAYPVFVPIQLYRRAHVAHHRDEFGPDEPDLALYRPYPCTRRALLRRLGRDAVGISGWKNLRPLLRSAVRRSPFRRTALSMVAVQAVLWAALWLATGRWWIYPLLWLAPWMTGWRVINRLRSIAEHGGLERSDDRRATTHNVRQTWLARFFLVPYNTGWHLAHHVDMGVPWRNLPAFHAELERAGYVTDAITHRSYWALWRALSSARPETQPGSVARAAA
jgi:fatty acid desaturase